MAPRPMVPVLLCVVLCALACSQPASGLLARAIIGTGSSGKGACGYGELNYPAVESFVAGFSAAIYKNGVPCGGCYQVRCYGRAHCRPGAVVEVTAVSECEAGVCGVPGAVGMSLDPRAWDLLFTTRAVPYVPVSAVSVPCSGVTGGVMFNITAATAYYIQVLIQNVGDIGSVKSVEMMSKGVAGGTFRPMFRSYGSIWAIQGVNFKGRPITIRMTLTNGKVMTFKKVLPADWYFGPYVSARNFGPPTLA